MEEMSEGARNFLQRTANNEKSPVPKVRRVSGRHRKAVQSIFTYLLAAVITVLVIWFIELTQIPDQDRAFWVAFKGTVEDTDFIFLAFSLAITAILDWLVSDNRKVTATWAIFEVILGLASLMLYALEETGGDAVTIANGTTAPSALSGMKFMIHLILILLVIVIAVVGFF